ncbi:hypothetical protein NPIL_170521 [Nephila pilipes]|uniref:Uncharacterized protein n=1 Tax=Nephila pilipes TaxID=299642 RepID=A0A8X6PTN7_NEPPI|nr:hypothetical protein NPIL_170521 [Nephila pilipes]
MDAARDTTQSLDFDICGIDWLRNYLYNDECCPSLFFHVMDDLFMRAGETMEETQWSKEEEINHSRFSLPETHNSTDLVEKGILSRNPIAIG